MTYYLHNNGTIRETAECLGGGLYCKPQLVAIIPVEDREQVERLLDAYRRTPGKAFDAMQAALREFADPKPPKPPDDVTARVTDRRDNIWRLLADGEWVCTGGPDIGEYLAWDRLAAERGPLEVRS